MRAAAGLALAAVLAACASGCAADPWDRESSWRPGEATQAGLARMAQDQRDLERGAREAPEPGQGASAAVERLTQDKAKLLGSVSTSSVAGAPK